MAILVSYLDLAELPPEFEAVVVPELGGLALELGVPALEPGAPALELGVLALELEVLPLVSDFDPRL